MYKIFLVFSLSLPISLYAQFDSLKFNFDILTATDHINVNKNTNKSIYLPSNIRTLRQKGHNTSLLHLPFNQLTDVPQYHASTFVGLLTKVSIKKGYDLSFDLFSENRGASFGTLRLDKVTIYPKIYLHLVDTINILNQKIGVEVDLNDMNKYQLNEGLGINNIDVQGEIFKLSWKNWQYQYTQIWDLSQHINLNINELFSHKISYIKRIDIDNSHKIGISYDNHLMFKVLDNENINKISFFIKKEIKKHQFYTEVSIRFSDTNNTITIPHHNTAALVGYEYKVKQKKHTWNFKAKGRYFGNNYNSNFTGNGFPKYRNPRFNITHNNSVGDYLYPLINTYNRFDQWSVYTDYQGIRLVSIALFSNSEVQLYKNWWVMADIETNFIGAEDTDNAFYFFYKTGVVFKMPYDTRFETYITNKIMNLDIDYQSFYQSINPLFGFSVNRIIGRYKQR